MLDEKILKLIRCPITAQSLRFAPQELVERLNEKIRRGTVRDAADERVSETVEQALVTADNGRLYPVRGGIPTLTADAAVLREQWEADG